MSKEGLKAAADDMEGFILSGQTLTRETIDEFKTVLDEMDDKLLTFDVWIYSESKQLAKLAFTSEDESVNTQLELVFFGHNEQFEVQIPENVKPIDELLADLFPVSEGLQANGIQSRASDTERRTDINAIATHLEAYYADHGYYPKSILGDVLTKGSFKLDPEALIDPDGQAVDSGDYSYEATNCSGNECEQFTLSAKLEVESAPYEKQSLN